MAWDAFLEEAGWPLLLPRVLFSVHRSLLAGRDSKDPFAGLVVSSEHPHAISMRREEVDIGKSTFGINLPTCRHSQALDCAEDSVAWLEGNAKQAATTGAAKRKSPELRQPTPTPA